MCFFSCSQAPCGRRPLQPSFSAVLNIPHLCSVHTAAPKPDEQGGQQQQQQQLDSGPNKPSTSAAAGSGHSAAPSSPSAAVSRRLAGIKRVTMSVPGVLLQESSPGDLDESASVRTDAVGECWSACITARASSCPCPHPVFVCTLHCGAAACGQAGVAPQAAVFTCCSVLNCSLWHFPEAFPELRDHLRTHLVWAALSWSLTLLHSTLPCRRTGAGHCAVLLSGRVLNVPRGRRHRGGGGAWCAGACGPAGQRSGAGASSQVGVGVEWRLCTLLFRARLWSLCCPAGAACCQGSCCRLLPAACTPPW
jgi:hypothetical protein